jgi:hypothetical protein
VRSQRPLHHFMLTVAAVLHDTNAASRHCCGGRTCLSVTDALTLFAAGIAMKCVWPRREQSLCVSLGARSDTSDLRYPPFQLLLLSGIQSGDGAARTNAEDEEHKPFSHDLPSSPG